MTSLFLIFDSWIFTEQKLWCDLAFRLTKLSSGTGAVGFISMAEPSTLVEKAVGRLNAA